MENSILNSFYSPTSLKSELLNDMLSPKSISCFREPEVLRSGDDGPGPACDESSQKVVRPNCPGFNILFLLK